jgi:hypothetical protein
MNNRDKHSGAPKNLSLRSPQQVSIWVWAERQERMFKKPLVCVGNAEDI